MLLHTEPNRERADRLAHYLMRSINKAHRRYSLFRDDDSILVAVSGGKDSLSLLDLLHRRLRFVRESYSLTAAHIRTDSHCGRAVPEDWLRQWCADRSIPLAIESIEIAQELATTHLSPCFRCAWNRRKALFSLADRLGCNALAFGHHADDVAQTTLMNLFYNGRIRPLEAKIRLFDGSLTVIRPLVFVEERDIVPYSRASGYPLVGEPCAAGEHSRRAAVSRVLRQLEREHPQIKRSISSAVRHGESAGARAGENSSEEG